MVNHPQETKHPIPKGTGWDPVVPPFLTARWRSTRNQLWRIFQPRLVSLVTLGLRLKLLSEPGMIRYTIPLSGSGRNFNQFPPGGGFNPCPTPPCWLSQVYFHPSQPLHVICVGNYLQNDYSVNTLFVERSVQSSCFRR